VTPRREDALYSKIAYTPAGEQADMYKYYCPLCMSFFQGILKSGCCGNYICSECCVDFLSKHQHQVTSSDSLCPVLINNSLIRWTQSPLYSREPLIQICVAQIVTLPDSIQHLYHDPMQFATTSTAVLLLAAAVLSLCRPPHRL
jgi:hypothetical protein